MIVVKVILSISSSMLCDFILKSILLVHLQDDIEKLRKAGIRDVLSFKAIVLNSNVEDVTNVTTIDKETWFISRFVGVNSGKISDSYPIEQGHLGGFEDSRGRVKSKN
jgi:hypothetical protein